MGVACRWLADARCSQVDGSQQALGWLKGRIGVASGWAFRRAADGRTIGPRSRRWATASRRQFVPFSRAVSLRLGLRTFVGELETEHLGQGFLHSPHLEGIQRA